MLRILADFLVTAVVDQTSQRFKDLGFSMFIASMTEVAVGVAEVGKRANANASRDMDITIATG